MKKTLTLLFLTLFCLSSAGNLHALETKKRIFDGSGEVISVDPLYSRVTIRHKAIKDFSGDAETSFPTDPALLKNIRKGDLVDFMLSDEGGYTRLEKIMKTGTASPQSEKLPLGAAMQDVLVGTGEVAKGIAQPIPPAHEVVSGAVGAATDTTGAILEGSDGTEVKKKF